ncbi:MAG: heavy metal translocating P-type ATPase metal-binding domain-containing protein [Methylococcales bacterium]|nr:heavy metal translocating P-type ATPase metal-binding domain-containing protein [Methylococcales bacterium]
MGNTKQHQEFCTLCGLAVEIEGFSVTTQKGHQRFCCAGCLSIYQLLNDDDIIHDDNIQLSLTTQL